MTDWNEIETAQIGPIKIDFQRRVIQTDESEDRLTPTETLLLQRLVGARFEVVSRDELYEDVLGEEYVYADRRVDTHMTNLRKKLQALFTGAGRWLRSKYGVGYVFRPGSD
jgi:two-component system response regulator CpxR